MSQAPSYTTVGYIKGDITPHEEERDWRQSYRANSEAIHLSGDLEWAVRTVEFCVQRVSSVRHVDLTPDRVVVRITRDEAAASASERMSTGPEEGVEVDVENTVSVFVFLRLLDGGEVEEDEGSR